MVGVICFNEKPCPDFFGYVGQRLDKRPKTNFEIYDVSNWKTKNYKTCFGSSQLGHTIRQISQYLRLLI